MLFGAILLTAIGFNKIGGFSGLLTYYGQATSPIDLNTSSAEVFIMNMHDVAVSQFSAGTLPTVDSLASSQNISSNLTCKLPSSNAFVMLRDISDSEMPWLGYILGQTPASIWYWCADQMMVQRVLAAKSLSHAQGATLMAGFIKIFPLFIIVLPGMISRILYPDTIGCGTAEECLEICGNRHGCSDWAYPKLVMGVMPDGLRGLMLAVMLAALMSDLTSIFNSSSTLFTVDLYTHFRRQAKNRELMIVGRVFVLVMVGLSILWVPVIQSMQGGQLYIYIQSVSGFLSPPIAAVYLMALLWKRNNELGAFTGLIYGFLIGITRMVLSFVYPDPICGEPDTRPWIVSQVHYMYFAMFSFFSTAAVMGLVSLCSSPPTEEQVRGLTFWTRKDATSSSPTDHVVPISEEIKLDPVDDSRDKTGEERAQGGESEKDAGLTKRSDLDKNFDERTSTITQSDASEDASVVDGQVSEGQGLCVSCLHVSGHMCQWFWGCTDQPCPEDVQCCCCLKKKGSNDQGTGVETEPLRIVPISLYQTRSAKIGLTIGLVVIITTTVFLFCFFSLYFGPITRGPLTVVGSTTSANISGAISDLMAFGIIANLTG